MLFMLYAVAGLALTVWPHECSLASARHYVVVLEFRRLGYATTMLRLSIQIAREKLSITRILVTCDDDNIGSIRTIEKNGGILENVVGRPDLDKPKRRYWIDAG